MTIEELRKELRADIANKLTFPRTILEMLGDGKPVDPKKAKTAVESLDDLNKLTDEWFNKYWGREIGSPTRTPAPPL